MDHSEKKADETKTEIRENHAQVTEEFDHLKQGQHSLEMGFDGLTKAIENGDGRSQQRRADRWKWLQYLIFPILLAAFLKVSDTFF